MICSHRDLEAFHLCYMERSIICLVTATKHHLILRNIKVSAKNQCNQMEPRHPADIPGGQQGSVAAGESQQGGGVRHTPLPHSQFAQGRETGPVPKHPPDNTAAGENAKAAPPISPADGPRRKSNGHQSRSTRQLFFHGMPQSCPEAACSNPTLLRKGWGPNTRHLLGMPEYI